MSTADRFLERLGGVFATAERALQRNLKRRGIAPAAVRGQRDQLFVEGGFSTSDTLVKLEDLLAGVLP